MKREVLAAILIGISIGLVFTYGIWLANKSLKQAGIKPPESPKTTQATPSPKPIQAATSVSNLNIPDNFLLTNHPSLTIGGQIEAGSVIIILSESTQYILPATSGGKFSQTINLETGYNRLKIITLDKEHNQSVINRLVTYSTTASLFTDSVITPKTSPSASPSNTLRDAVKDKVAQEIAQIRQNSSKKAYLGSISAKSDANLTLIDLDNATKQIITTAETVFKLKNNSEGTIKDLKSGDFLLVMGDADANGQLVAKRILILDQPKDDLRLVISDTVTAFTGKTLTVNKTVLNITKDTLFQPAKYKFKDIDPGFKLIAVYTPTATPLVYIVSEK